MADSKACFKCGQTKQLSEFYKHPAMADGHLGKCKACAKRDAHEHREKNLEKIRAYDSARANLPHRVKAAIKQAAKWRAQDKRRMRCHNAIARALRSGKIAPLPCANCGAEPTVAHHPDYDKPLEVVWMCHPCHVRHHKKNPTIPF